MAAGKLGTGVILAGIVTFLLLVLMYRLVKVDEVVVQEPSHQPVDPVQVPPTITEVTKPPQDTRPKPMDPPPGPVEPPVDNPPTPPGTTGTVVEITPPPVGPPVVKVDVSGPGILVQPVYPESAVQRGIEGYCVVEFTITKTGAAKDARAVDCQPQNVFEKTSVEAISKSKFAVQTVNGEAVEMPGVQNRFTFEIEK